jgi:hypothetical protein
MITTTIVQPIIIASSSEDNIVMIAVPVSCGYGYLLSVTIGISSY